jgi:hypothetical protein
MNLTIETVMSENYFAPEKIANVQGLLYLHFTHKPDALKILDA